MGAAHANSGQEQASAGEIIRLQQLLADCQCALQRERNDHGATRRQLAYYRELLDELPTPVFAKDAALRFVFFNRAYETYFQIKGKEQLGKTVRELAYLPEQERDAFHLEDAEMLRTAGTTTYEKAFLLPGGETRTALYSSRGIVDSRQQPFGLVGMLVDITGQKTEQQSLSQQFKQLLRAHEQTRALSLTDELTGLANRRDVSLQLKKLVMQAEQGHLHSLNVILLDLDHFKQINDCYGHDAGDRVLQSIARAMRGACRESDIVARLGGEEFLCLLPGAEAAVALKVAERIRTVLPGLKDCPCPVRCSAGITSFQPGDTPATLLKRADSALYRAKQTGRDRSVVF